MPRSIEYTTVGSDELSEILAIYPLAFPDEELRPLVKELTTGGWSVLSIAARCEGALIGHCLFTIEQEGALLGPVCVTPNQQFRGVGSSMIKTGLRQLEGLGVRQVFVLGDPSYYGRFGFLPEQRITPPCPIPNDWQDAWRSMTLSDRPALPAGLLPVAAPWRAPALWTD
ncbi:hypothetical protein TRL7639_01791 [Falsiruegeria litorea R37]|uniref:N-acetyltransferase domain-containing protein n=1 Tax=Falsiruegeria litorea R37 TaxID=1200284 RepID=A0A1Y5SDJ5_9RHOB|nr:N-acetyltransferase [Falsiruegeria litorea]SLN36722.1 hypothetical protein TRL7639_01791 [Falsiruegeria litorea R37]